MAATAVCSVGLFSS